MSLTLLIDLDNTLLANGMDTFLPAYLKLLSGELSRYASPEPLIKTLLAATHQMDVNRRPDCTLREVFSRNFYPVLGLDEDAMQAPLEHFYKEVFPQLQAITQPVPGVQALIEGAFERGYRVVIATNPLFPAAAMRQRLAWAGLPVDRYPFSLVTSYEEFHFAKPNPAYHAEILARLGWPEGPVAVVGDDPENDINAARLLGLPAFWIQNGSTPVPQGWTPPPAGGTIDQVLPWLEQLEATAVMPDFTGPEAIRSVLRSTPAAIDTVRRSLSAVDWSRRPAPNQWSPAEIVCHFRDVDREVNLPRLEKVLADDNPFLPGMDTDPWAKERDYEHQDGPHALVQFFAVRLKMLEKLDTLAPTDWDRQARHAILGPTRISELLGITATHDRLHVKQFIEAVAPAS